MQEWIANRPWIWIVLLFIGLIVLWSKFFALAERNQPKAIPIPAAVKSYDSSN